MARMLALVTAAAVGSGLTGCASNWDALTSQRFRDAPMHTMFGADDPVVVLRTNPDGDARARAMRTLSDKVVAKLSDADRADVLEHLASAAATDPSAWVRVAAVDALGRFTDPRTTEALVVAFHQAAGRPAAAAPPAAANPGHAAVVQVGGRLESNPLGDRLGLTGPQGFPGELVANIRGRAVAALARTGRPEAVEFLARVAVGQEQLVNEDPAAQILVRQHATKGLASVRRKDAVVALAAVLAAETGKDVTLANLAYSGLVDLTGRATVPPEPEKWNAVVQAGFEVVPEPNAVQRAAAAVRLD